MRGTGLLRAVKTARGGQGHFAAGLRGGPPASVPALTSIERGRAGLARLRAARPAAARALATSAGGPLGLAHAPRAARSSSSGTGQRVLRYSRDEVRALLDRALHRSR